jgi:hypothetical protein
MAYTLFVPRTGRPRKPTGEKYVGRLIKAKPELWARLDAEIPEKQRAAFVRDAIDRALKLEARRKQRQEEGAEDG